MESIEHRTSNIRTSNFERRTSNIETQTPEIEGCEGPRRRITGAPGPRERRRRWRYLQAGVAVTSLAADAGAQVHRRFVDANAHRRGVRLHAARFEDFEDLFDARLVANRRLRIFC